MVLRFRRSTVVLVIGLLVIGAYVLASLAYGDVTMAGLGLGSPDWASTIGYAAGGLVITVAYSPLADRLASYWFEKPPTLESFRGIQQSKAQLITGIVLAWLLGGILEELVARGIILRSVDALLTPWLTPSFAAVLAMVIAAAGAGLLHSYQGPRAVLIITQLSFLFGVLFVVSGYNLWTVMICHGLYDTIAFIRFAGKKSKYSELDKQN